MFESAQACFDQGLTVDQRKELLGMHNGTLNVPELIVRCAELREEYKDNPYALEEIDFNDFSSPYSIMLSAYYETYMDNNAGVVGQFDDWFSEQYPLHAKRL